MSITGLTAVTRVAPTTANTPTETARPQQPSAAPAVKIDAVTQLPAPPRFPWLTRLSLQLEHAAGQKAAFAPAPILGDNVNRSA